MRALVRLKRWRQEGRCLRGRHAWTKVHDAIWHGAYVACSHCGKRDVIGGDQYGPHAPLWRAYGSPPPETRPTLGGPAGLPVILWGRREWDAWRVRCRATADSMEDERSWKR